MSIFWIRLDLTGISADPTHTLEKVLDAGYLQDALEERGVAVASATAELPGATRGDGRVVLTPAQAKAAGAAVAAMLAGAGGPGEGDWPEEVTDRAMRAAADKLGVR